jgi:hypothetical protein
MRFFILIVIALVTIMVTFFVANPLAQKILPTVEGDSAGRRYGYDLLVKLIYALILGAVIGLIFLYESLR